MLDTIALPVAFCPACRRDVLACRDLSDDGAWLHLCTRCGAPIGPPEKRFGVTSVAALGYTFGQGDGGCGSGGCSSCAPKAYSD